MVDTRNWFSEIPSSRLRQLRASCRYGCEIEIENRRYVNFSSNDYLGLANDASVMRAAKDAIDHYGFGSGGSRLISGDHPLLHQLEGAIAAWKGYEAALVVGSGMLMNIGLLPALVSRHETIFSDKLNHASLVDGVRLSGAKSVRYGHGDMQSLARALARSLDKADGDRRIIVSDGVFSMDGDIAELQSLAALAQQYDALLLVDDAHGVGVCGTKGLGAVNLAGLQGGERLIEVGTFGKAFGSYGAYVLGTTAMIEGLRQRMRTLIYSTALPPAITAATLAALPLIQQGDLIARLHANIDYFRQQMAAGSLMLMPSTTAIQPIVFGSDEAALAAAERLKEAGFFVPAIRPPTVPEGSARLRVTLSAAHERGQIEGLIQALNGLA
ncbi:MAG: 8-amino-7-oxononanoate synthase [Zetaproteobacteria bacterium]|nr:8-amino-7-oxononanoate synthase [Zetaproteobacteria bacterium]